MTIVFKESWESREASQPESGTGSGTRIWYAYGSNDPEAVYTAALADTDVMADYGTLPANSLAVSPLALDLCMVTVSHGALTTKPTTQTNPEPEQLADTGDYVATFSTMGGTFHITEAQAQTAYGTNAPDCGKTIGWQKDQAPEGVDIVVPQLSFTIRKRFASSSITDSYIRTLADLTGKVNNATYLGWSAGELLFLGAEGSQATATKDKEVTFHFAASRNLTGQTIAGITSIAKKGHDYVWVKYKDQEGANAIEPAAVGVYVASVYKEGDFSGLSI